jgi:hypothetical protein
MANLSVHAFRPLYVFASNQLIHVPLSGIFISSCRYYYVKEAAVCRIVSKQMKMVVVVAVVDGGR